MEQQTELIPIEQKEIEFYGDELIAIRANDGHIYVSIRHMCRALQIDDQGQRQRIRRHSILSEGERVCKIHTHQRGLQSSYVLRAEFIPLWLAGISARSIKNEGIRLKLEQYQREATKVLWEAFQEGRLTNEPVFSDLLMQNSPEVQAYKLAMAVANMARQQIMFKAQVENQSAQLQDHSQRLELIETQLGRGDHFITEGQAMEISQAVKAIAFEMTKRSKQNEFGGIYGELYRKFNITGYKQLPAQKFAEAIEFLTEWHGALVNDAPF